MMLALIVSSYSTIIAESYSVRMNTSTDLGIHYSTVAQAQVAPFVSQIQAVSIQTISKEVTVYATKTGSKYHRDGCRYLSKSKIPMSLSKAKKVYSPCSVCKPLK